MQREMLSHFIILSNGMSIGGDQKDGTSTCTKQVKKYTQNNKGIASAWMLLENCRAAIAARKQMMIWGYPPPRKKLKLWNRALLKKPRKTQKSFLEWPTPEKHPLGDLRSSSMPCAATEEKPSKLCLKHCLKPCQKSSNETRAGPLLNLPA